MALKSFDSMKNQPVEVTKFNPLVRGKGDHRLLTFSLSMKTITKAAQMKLALMDSPTQDSLWGDQDEPSGVKEIIYDQEFANLKVTFANHNGDPLMEVVCEKLVLKKATPEAGKTLCFEFYIAGVLNSPEHAYALHELMQRPGVCLTTKHSTLKEVNEAEEAGTVEGNINAPEKGRDPEEVEEPETEDAF